MNQSVLYHLKTKPFWLQLGIHKNVQLFHSKTFWSWPRTMIWVTLGEDFWQHVKFCWKTTPHHLSLLRCLCRVRIWTEWSSWIPSSSEYSVIWWFFYTKASPHLQQLPEPRENLSKAISRDLRVQPKDNSQEQVFHPMFLNCYIKKAKLLLSEAELTHFYHSCCYRKSS